MRTTFYNLKTGSSVSALPIDAGAFREDPGWSETPVQSTLPTPAPEPELAATLPALSLINSATTAEEISALPTIGKVTAGKILEARPGGGFDSLADIQAIGGTERVDWESVEAWEED